LIETASDTVARVQPNSSSSGRINTPGTERMPAVNSMIKNVTATTIQA
jgi:hypothetical protein